MTPTVNKVLVPVDFSSRTQQVLDFATDLAKRYEASLDLIYVYEPLTYALPEGYVLVTPDQLREILGQFEKQLAGAKQRAAAAGVPNVQTVLLQGSPIGEILRYAQERGTDLIVMGTHGRTGARRLFIGSVAENIVRASKCPVLTVRTVD